MICRVLAIGGIGLLLGALDARAFEYNGLCEASAGAFVDAKHFVVASDETNRLQLYERGKADPVGSADMETFTSFDKSDLEAAAAIGNRIYWISSHSLNSKGNDKDKRKVFFATAVGVADGKPTLKPVGTAATGLRDALAAAAGAKPRELNVEALAATPDGELLIGLRSPVRGNMALVVPFKNPAAVVEKGAAPEFGKAVSINLMGLGLRSMEMIPGSGARYIILAGPVSDDPGFAAFLWNGPGTEPKKIEGIDLKGLKPEGAMIVPGQNLVQLLSDDGDICSDEDDPPGKRRFRSVDIELKSAQ
jgi:Protein of unknown function (DUF3616)